ncbi:hypothetical protein AB0K60_16585 [Thermopolyspora sp. NPDC052614]|uniref:hypothetical protein n=1 Tax=Thermopolyspora sp. NPDC052614 TaxID=3155682 RepID=UPI003412F05D
MEWQFAKILLLYRALHVLQWFGTAPAMVRSLTPVWVGIVIVVLAGAETVALTARLIHLREYGGARTALMQVGTGVVMLALAAVAAPPTDRTSVLAPLVIWTTGQISGAALAKSPPVLIAGTAAISATYIVAIALANPADLLRSETIIALSGFVALAVLIERGTSFLRRSAADLSDLSRRAAEERHHRELTDELHNHWAHIVHRVAEHDCGRAGEFEHLRGLLFKEHARLRAFIDTGRPAERLGLVETVHREIRDAAELGLVAEPLLSQAFRERDGEVPQAVLDALESALRAVLLNVVTRARCDRAFIRADVDGDLVSIAVRDLGPGFPPDVRLNSLARHRERLRALGGDLCVSSSEHGSTVILKVRPDQGGDPR